MEEGETYYPNVPEDRSFEEQKFLLDPRSKGMKKWDGFIAFLLFYTALVTPFEISFLTTDKDNIHLDHVLGLFVFNCIVAVSFFLDILVKFNLVYFDPDIGSGLWVTDRSKIAKRYLTGFFLIDLVSIIPFGAFGLVMDSDAAGHLVILKQVRLLRLLKLARIAKSGKIFQRIQERIDISNNLMTLYKFVLGTLMIAHWLGCFWHLVSRIEADYMEGTWVENYFGDFEDIHGPPDEADRYIASLYWAIVTLTTIGYGDVVPTSTAERLFVIFSMLIGTSIFAYVVGSVCTIVANMDKKSSAYHEMMDNLGAFMREQHLSDSLRARLKAYFRFKKDSPSDDAKPLLELMSPALRADVAWEQCGSWVNDIPFFVGVPRDFVIEVALILQSCTYPQNEEIIKVGALCDKMFIVQRGVVGGLGRVFTSGKVFGIEILCGNLESDYTARAMTYCDLYSIDKSDLLEIVQKFPAVLKNLRIAATRLTCKKYLTSFGSSWKRLLKGHPFRRLSEEQQEELDEGQKLKYDREKQIADVAGKAVSATMGLECKVPVLSQLAAHGASHRMLSPRKSIFSMGTPGGSEEPGSPSGQSLGPLLAKLDVLTAIVQDNANKITLLEGKIAAQQASA